MRDYSQHQLLRDHASNASSPSAVTLQWRCVMQDTTCIGNEADAVVIRKTSNIVTPHIHFWISNRSWIVVFHPCLTSQSHTSHMLVTTHYQDVGGVTVTRAQA